MNRITYKKLALWSLSTAVCALLYTYQNIEIFKIGYSINNNQRTLANFLDQHRRLVYNLNKLKTPLALDEKLLAKNVNLIELDTENIYIASVKTNGISSNKRRRTPLIDAFLDVFTVKAEARTARSFNTTK